MTGADIPSVPDERAVAIREFSAEAREAVVHNMVAAEMYHQVQTGTPEAIRQAAQWIITDAQIEPHSLRLDDDDYLTDKKLTHLITAQEKVTEAGRIESWAEALLEVGDSPGIAALKSLVMLEELELTDIEKRPEDMLKFEDETVALGGSIEAHRAEIIDISEKLDQQTDIETINVASAVKQSKLKTSDTVTAVELASLQREILIQQVEAEETRFRNRTELVEALRTGQVSEGLREIISSKVSQAGDSARDEILLDSTGIEALMLSSRAYNCLKRGGIGTIGELAGRTERELKGIINLGDGSLDEIKGLLASKGLYLRRAAG